MPINVIATDPVEIADVPQFSSPKFVFGFTVDGTPNTDADGGRMIAGVDPSGLATLTYADADGTLNELVDVLPDGASFTQGEGIPIGPEAASFLMVFEVEDETSEAFDFLAVATLDKAGVPALALLDDDLVTYPGGMLITTSLTAMADGRIGVVSEFLDASGNAVSTIGVIAAEATGLAYTQLFVAGENVLPEASVIALADGGTVVVWADPSTGESTINLAQFDAAGAGLGTAALTDEQMNGIGFPASESAFQITVSPEGELVIYASDRFGDEALAITYDLSPEQEGAVPITLPEVPEGGYFEGTEGDETLIGTAGSDEIYAGGGDDVVRGFGGFDYLDLGEGNDTAFGGDGEDYIDGGSGDNLLFGGNGDDYVGAGGSFMVEDGNNDLRGGEGDDIVAGGEGNDVLRGNRGDDEMFGNGGDDDLNGGFGNDTVNGSDGDDKVSGFDGDDSLYGGAGDDRLHGGRGDDLVFGGDGNDILRGAEGDDTLTGGAGDDLLIGGAGADVFAFDLIKDQVVDYFDFDDEGPGGLVLTIEDPEGSDNGRNLIKDFTIGEDKIALDGSYLIVDPEDELATLSTSDLTFDDIFLSQEDSVAVIQAGDTTIRLQGVNVDELSEDDFVLL